MNISQKPQWARRRASLVVVAALADYAPKQIKASFPQMFQTAVDFTKVGGGGLFWGDGGGGVVVFVCAPRPNLP